MATETNVTAHAVAANDTAESEAHLLEKTQLKACFEMLMSVRLAHPAWFELYDDSLVNTATRAELVELLSSAPNDFTRGLLYGVFGMRLEIEAITGRNFI